MLSRETCFLLAALYQERDQLIHEEIARLEKLQRLAEKVHQEAKHTDSRLDDIEAWIEDEAKRIDHLHPRDAKANCDEAGGDGLAEIHSLEDHNVLLYLATKWNYEKSLTVSQFLLGEHRHLKSQVLFKATIDGLKIKRNFATSNPVNQRAYFILQSVLISSEVQRVGLIV